MAAARYDITIDQGSDFSLQLTVKEGITVYNFLPDTTEGAEKAWGARASYRKTLEAGTAYNLPAQVSGLNDGIITIDHTRNDNLDAAAGTYLYDLEIYQYDNTQAAQTAFTQQGTAPTEFSVTRLIGGTLTLRREVTR